MLLSVEGQVAVPSTGQKAAHHPIDSVDSQWDSVDMVPAASSSGIPQQIHTPVCTDLNTTVTADRLAAGQSQRRKQLAMAASSVIGTPPEEDGTSPCLSPRSHPASPDCLRIRLLVGSMIPHQCISPSVSLPIHGFVALFSHPSSLSHALCCLVFLRPMPTRR